MGDGRVTAPMPGTVLAVTVETGQAVAADETLAVMEAMKMELSLRAPFDGVVTRVAASGGDQVELGAELFVVEPPEAGGS
jgi:3-methylcrotonyl-CoA carboxylase alpha subunit/acetyl-CoA/propionyl-CoA carboxylase biotin carboxyl carrier protein